MLLAEASGYTQLRKTKGCCEGDGKCSEDNVVISEGIYYLKLFIKVLEADTDANVLFLVREMVMYLSKYFQS